MTTMKPNFKKMFVILGAFLTGGMAIGLTDLAPHTAEAMLKIGIN
jgi:hypothetical protein